MVGRGVVADDAQAPCGGGVVLSYGGFEVVLEAGVVVEAALSLRRNSSGLRLGEPEALVDWLEVTDGASAVSGFLLVQLGNTLVKRQGIFA